MALVFTGQIQLNINGSYSNPATLGTPLDPIVKNIAVTIASGVGAGQCDRIWYNERTLTTGANEDLDLVGSFTDSLGTSVAPARFKGLLIYSLPANTTTLTIKPGAANGIVGLFGAAAHTLTIRPSTASSPSFFFIWAGDATGYALTAATADLLNVANSAGASATYDIVVLGCSA